jgi:branched-chain amino acid transport system substrate-binding protein
MKAGILYPSSTAYPAADLDFINGIRACLAASGATGAISLTLESIGNGGAEKEVYSKAQKLLRIDGVDMVVAFADLKVIPLLEPLFFASGKLLLVVNPGANHPQNWLPQPNVLYLTLGHAFLNWICGRNAAEQGHREAAIATSFYDCGYLHGAAMVRGFMENGGAPAYNYVNNQAYDERFEIAALTGFLAGNPQVHALLCTFDAAPAALFYERFAAAPITQDHELFVSPMMLQPEAVRAIPEDAGFQIQGYSPWNAGSEAPANQRLREAFAAMTGTAPDLFALLGWEAGMILESIAKSGSAQNCETLLAGLMATTLDSPRGSIWLDPATNHFIAPILHCRRVQAELRQTELPEAFIREAWTAFSAYELEGVASGWTNTYLCY